MGELEDLRVAVRRLTDRVEIAEVIDRFGTAADARDWAALDRVLTPDVILDHTDASDSDASYEAVWRGFDEVVERVSIGSERHLVTHHALTNHRIVLAGDQASAVAYLTSVHADAGEPPTAQIQQGWYLLELVRTADGWRIRHLKPSLWKALVLPIAQPLTATHLDARRRELREHFEPRHAATTGGRTLR